MDDVDENAAIVNALQRRSDVIVQKSLAEGFGLTVAEAMWKGRPTVGSRVGGIQDQIAAGESGLLVEPDDPVDVGVAISRMLSEPADAARMGETGRRSVIEAVHGVKLPHTPVRAHPLRDGEQRRMRPPPADKLSEVSGRLSMFSRPARASRACSRRAGMRPLVEPPVAGED